MVHKFTLEEHEKKIRTILTPPSQSSLTESLRRKPRVRIRNGNASSQSRRIT